MADDGSSEMIEIDLAEWKKLKVGELRKNVGELGLETKGTKAELISRLEKYLNEQEADLLEEEEEEELEEEEGGINEEGTEAEEENAEDKTEEEQQPEEERAEQTNTSEKNENGKITGPGGSNIPVLGGDSNSSLTQTERLKSRQERFGTGDSAAAKRQARAERFGLAVSDYQGLGKRPGTAPTAAEVEKMKKRAERFGTASGSTVLNKIADGEKKQKRIDRFGLSAVDLSLKDRQDKRKQRFGI